MYRMSHQGCQLGLAPRNGDVMRNVRRLSQDETNVVEAANRMYTHVRNRPELEWYALVDTVFDYPDGKFVGEFVDAINCYTGDSKLDALATAAPCLVPLPDDDGLMHRLTSLLRHCSARPMLSFFASEAGSANILENWRAFYMAQLDDGQEMLLRFADTRVLPNLQHVLTSDQWGALCSEIRCWHYVGRNGGVMECAVSNALDCARGQLHLSSHQVDQLVELSYPDILLGRIVESLPEAIPSSTRFSSLYEFTAASYRLAQEYVIDNETDVFSLAVAACLSNGKSNESAELYRLLKSKAWSPGNLGDEMFKAGIV